MDRNSSLAVMVSCVLWIVSSAASAQDVSAGRNVYLAKCISCHKFNCNSNGPLFEGLFGRQVGTAEGYDTYTQGLLDAQFAWSEETLDKFLSAPNEMFPESTMAWAGKVENSEDRRNLIAYMQTDDPTVDLCPK